MPAEGLTGLWTPEPGDQHASLLSPSPARPLHCWPGGGCRLRRPLLSAHQLRGVCSQLGVWPREPCQIQSRCQIIRKWFWSLSEPPSDANRVKKGTLFLVC